jgi:hypothetical protein
MRPTGTFVADPAAAALVYGQRRSPGSLGLIRKRRVPPSLCNKLLQRGRRQGASHAAWLARRLDVQ